MTQKRGNFFALDSLENGRIYYETAGQGKPVVLSHAGFVDGRMWNDQWSALAQHYHAIRFDMRGFGQSDRVDAPLNRRQDLYRLLQHLDIDRAALVGCSLSGEIILDFALEHPQMVSALVLVSAVPGGFELQGPPPPNLMEMFGAMQQGDLALASELQNRIWVDGPFRRPDQVDSLVRERVAEMNRIALLNQTMLNVDTTPLDPLDPPAVQRLREISAPTLIIAGELDHPELQRAADLMADEIPGAQKVIMPGCAHLPNMEQPETFNRLVLDFIPS